MKYLLVKLNFIFGFLLALNGSLAYSQCSINSIGDTTICLGNSVNLGSRISASGAAPIIYDWTPATGLSCTDCPNPTATPLITTTYTLTITDDNGCSTSQDITVNITPDPVAGFNFLPDNVCANTPIQFSSTSTGTGLSFAWDFDNPTSGSNSSTQPNPIHEFITTGTGTVSFDVTLTVTNNFGCQDAITQTVTINQIPDAVLVDPITTFRNCDGTNYNLTVYDNSSVTGVNHEIIWGDGSPNYVNAVAPSGGASHLYTTSDIFDMYYIITGANGCSDTSHYLVSNITNPAVGAANPGATSGCGPLELCFPLSSYSGNHPSTYYVVDYGDNSPNDTLPHPPPATLCHTYTESSCGQAGNSFTFNIQAINQCDMSEASISPIRVYTGPTANFSIPLPNYCVNTAVPFQNLSQLGFNSSCAATTLFTWNFGDGTTQTAFSLTNPTHVYTTPGTYTVTLTASNNCSTTTHEEIVCIEQPPTPDFTLTPDTACVPFAAVTTNLSSLLNTCDVDTLWNVNFIQSSCIPIGGNWSFANGTNNTSSEPEFTISSPGEYNIRLNLTNSCGTFFHEQVVLGQAPPQVTLTTFTPICEGENINPTAVVNDCYEPADSYSWTFGGGVPNSSTDLIPGSVSYANAGSYSIDFSVTNACGTTNASTPITVYEPPVADAGLDTNSCSNIAVGIGSTPVGGVSYSWTPSTGLSNASIANPTVTINNISGAPVDYTFVVTASTSANCFTRDTVIVTVYPLPDLIVNSPTICIGGNAALSVSGIGVGGTYNWSPATGLSCTDCDNPTSNPTTTTVYTITGTTAQGCVNTTTSNVTVNPLPIVNAGNDLTLCDQPVPVVLNGTPVGGTWSGSPNVTAGGTFTPNGTEISNLIYSYTDGTTNCSNTDTLIVTVNPLIVPTANPLDSICFSSPATDLNTIFNPNPLGGIWSGNGVTDPNFSASIAGLGTHTLTYTLGTSTCASSVDVEIIVNPEPVLITSDETICFGDDIPLNVSGAGIGGSYSWTPATGLSCTDCDNPLANPTSTTIYTITGTTLQGCSADVNSTVTVNPLPVVNAGSDLNLCDQPIPVTLNGTPAGGTWSGSPNVTVGGTFTPNGSEVSDLIYSYTDGVTNCSNSDTLVVTVNPPITPTVGPLDSICINAGIVDLNTVFNPSNLGGVWSGTGVTNPNFNPSTAGTGTHTLTYTLGAGTCQTSVTTDIEVNPEPVLVASDETICFGDNVQLNISGVGTGGSYSWTPATGLSCTNCDNPIANPTSTTVYTITGTTDKGCSADINSIVTVNPLPVVNAGSDLNLCDQPIPVALNGTPGGGLWSGSPNVTIAGVFTPNGTEISDLIYSYTDGATNCSNTDTLVVTVNPPIVPTVNPLDSICINASTIDLNTVFNPSNLGGTWTGAGVTNPNFNPSTAGVGTHTLTYTLGTGTCQTSVTTEIEVNPQPTIVSSDETICFGGNVQLGVNGAGAGGSYVWAPGTDISCTNCDNPIANPTSTTIYNITGTTTKGCSNSTTSTVSVNPLPVVDAGVDTSICNLPVAVQLNGTPAGGVWSGPNISPTGEFIPNGVGSFTVTYTITLGTGCVDSSERIVNVLDPTLSDAGSDLEACIGGATVVLNGLPASGTWSGSFVTSGGVFTPSTSGVYELIYSTGAGNCLTVDTMEFTVHDLPIVDAGNNVGICISEAAFDLTGNPTGGLWSGTGITDVNLGTFDPAIATVGTHTITYTITDPITSCVNDDNLDVVVNPLPVVDFLVDSLICLNSNVDFINNSTLAFSSDWNFGDGGTSNVNSPSYVYTATGLYDITLVVTTTNGCIDSLTKSVSVLDLPNAQYTFNPTVACGPVTASFTNTSTGIANTYQWDFGNGTTSILENPLDVNYIESQYSDTVYTITLTATNYCGSDTHTDTIVVEPTPTAIFGTDFDTGCTPFEVNIANTSIGSADNYYWDFGDGTTSTTTSSLFQHTYYTGNTPTSYTITLIAENNCGSDTTTYVVTATPILVDAFFNTSVTSGCAPLTVDFTQYTLGGTQYSWNFDDGNVSTVYSPTHTFTNAGTYNVSLSANDGCGYDTTTVTITVHPEPTIDFTSNPTTVCVNEPFNFTNLSVGIGGVNWDFGDGNTSVLVNPSHAYNAPGVYNVTLSGTSLTYGCIASVTHPVTVSATPTAQFTANPTNGCVPLNVQMTNTSLNGNFYYWDFGDGNTSNLLNPNHVYANAGTYTIRLIVENLNGCTDTIESNVTAYPLPIADFSINQPSVCLTTGAVSFTNLSTGAVGYSWDFGNGQSSVLTNPSLNYTSSGTYTVTLTATSQYGCVSSIQKDLNFYDYPIASYNIPLFETCEGNALTFNSTSTGANSIEWFFGNSDSETGNSVSYTYPGVGNYTVTMVAYGGGGCNDTLTISQPIVIYPTPVADFNYENIIEINKWTGLVGFYNLSTNANNYTWYFGDGASSNDIDPEHSYNTHGDFNVTLIASNSFGCSDTIRKLIDVKLYKGLYLPNAMYPSHTDFNVSHFVPVGVGLKEFELLIFDDWGNLIWSTNALDANGRPTEAWDGTFEGVPVQQDAYVWKVNAVFLDDSVWEGKEYEKNKIKKAGTVTVIR